MRTPILNIPLKGPHDQLTTDVAFVRIRAVFVKKARSQ